MKASHCIVLCKHTAAILIAVAAVICIPVSRADDMSDWSFALRNQNPFLQVFGLPAYQSAELVERGRPTWRLALDITNHADAGVSGNEDFSIDGETYFLTVSMRRRVTNWLEVGFDLPFLSHTDGFMDNAIEGWHDLLGLSNSKRSGPDNELLFLYQRDGIDLYRLETPVSGLGDAQLTAAIPIREGLDGRSAISIRSSVKLPTGDPDNLLGSGGTDVALGLYATRRTGFHGHALAVTGFAGGVLLGDGDVLPDLQHGFVAFGGVGATWHVRPRIALVAQLHGQRPFIESGVEELGGSSIQLAVGAGYRTRNDKLWRIAVVEDMEANATPDFALHFSFTVSGR